MKNFWKVIEIGGKRLLTSRHQPFGFNHINEGLCWYKLISLDYEFDVDGVSEEHLGLLGCVFRHQQRESTPNVQYYSCNKYPQCDCAIICNIKQSLAIPFLEPSGRCCIGVLEMVLTTEMTNSIDIWALFFMETSAQSVGPIEIFHAKVQGLTSSKCMCLYDEKDMDETLKEIKKMLEVVCSTHYLPLAWTWVSCRLCNAVSRIYRTYYRERHMLAFLNIGVAQHLQKGQRVVGRAVSFPNLVFWKDITQFSITSTLLYTMHASRDPRIALVPLLTIMKQHLKIFKVASGEELGEESSIKVLDFSEDGKLYSYQIPQTARSPNRMENGEEIVWLDLSSQQLPEVDAIDSGNNVVSNTEENNNVVTSTQQNCIINSSQRLQKKARIPFSLEDLQRIFGMKLKEAAKALAYRSTVKRTCREYNITWWSPCKRSKDNHSLSNKLVQGAVQEQIQEPSQPPISDPPCKQDMATVSSTKPHFIKAKYGDDFIKFHPPVSSGI
ncbi:unnamed protein product [Camellia sinensis]